MAGRKPLPDTPEILEIITQPNHLQDMQALTLRERCAKLSQATNTYIDIHRLKRLYNKIGIRYLKPQKVFLLSDERK